MVILSDYLGRKAGIFFDEPHIPRCLQPFSTLFLSTSLLIAVVFQLVPAGTFYIFLAAPRMAGPKDQAAQAIENT